MGAVSTGQQGNDRGQRYQKFFQDVLDEIRQRHPGTFSALNIGTQGHLNLPAGISGFSFPLAFGSGSTFRMELYIDTGSRQTNKQVFDTFTTSKNAIEEKLGVHLKWERLDNRRASRISWVWNEAISIMDSPEKLDLLKKWVLENYDRFRTALAPYLENLATTSSEAAPAETQQSDQIGLSGFLRRFVSRPLQQSAEASQSLGETTTNRPNDTRVPQATSSVSENGFDARSEIRELLEGLIESDSEFSLDHSIKSYIRFYHALWTNLDTLNSGDGWTPSRRILLFEFENRKDRLTFFLTLGPGDPDIRNSIFEFATTRTRHLNPSRDTLSPKWNRLFRRNILISTDFQAGDIEALLSKVRREWESSVRDNVIEMAEAISARFGPR